LGGILCVHNAILSFSFTFGKRRTSRFERKLTAMYGLDCLYSLTFLEEVFSETQRLRE
jgi:hypothetical protein